MPRTASAQVPSYTIETRAGQGVAGANFGLPMGVAVDGMGNVYVADTNNCVVWEISGGATTLLAGGTQGCAPAPNYANLNPANPNGLLSPVVDVATCGGNVYFATHGYDGINVPIPPGTPLPPNPIPNASGQVFEVNSMGTLTQLSMPSPVGDPLTPLFPVAIACDSNGDVFVSSYFWQVDAVLLGQVDEIKYNPATTVPTVTAAYYSTLNIFSGAFDTVFPALAAGSNGSLYALSAHWSEDWLGTTTTTGDLVQLTGGSNEIGISGAGGIPTIGRLAVDLGGNFYISYGSLVDYLPVDGGPLTTIAGLTSGSYPNGEPGYNGDSIASTSAELNNPEGLAVDASGDVFIADALNGRVRELFRLQPLPTTFSLVPAPAGLCTPLGNQQYALNETTNDFFCVAGPNAIDVIGNRANPNVESVEAIIPIGAGTVGNGPSNLTLIVDPLRNLVYVNNPADGNVYLVDGSSYRVTSSVAINNPNATLLAIDPGLNQVYVGGPNSPSVSAIEGPVGGAGPVLLLNVGYPASFLASLGVDPNSHNIYAVCDACAGTGTEEGLITINGKAETGRPVLSATSEVFPANESVVSPDFVPDSLVVDPVSGSPIIAGAASIDRAFAQLYEVFDFDPGLESYKPYGFDFPPISVSLDAQNRVFYVTDADGNVTDPASNAAALIGMDNGASGGPLTAITIPANPEPVGSAQVYDIQPDTNTFAAYVWASTTPTGGGPTQSAVEVWDGSTEKLLPQTVTIPNNGGGRLAVDSTNHFVFVIDNVNDRLYIINGPAFTSEPAPIFSPPAGPEPPGTTVTITPGVAGDTVYYTTNGTAPSTSNGTTCSLCQVAVNPSGGTTTINAIEVSPSSVPSSVVAATYTAQQSTGLTIGLSQTMTAGGIPVTATATISPTSTGTTLSGTVTFLATAAGSTQSTVLCAAVTVANKAAVCVFALTVMGSYSIEAEYSGDAYDAASTNSMMLTVTSSGSASTTVSIPFTVTPVAFTTNNTGSASTYVWNSDGSVSVLQDASFVSGGCPIGALVPSGESSAALYFDPSSQRLYMATSASGMFITYETVNGDGTCFQGPVVQLSTSFGGNIEMTVDPTQGNAYLVESAGGGISDILFVLNTSAFSTYTFTAGGFNNTNVSVPQLPLDYSATYGPILVDASTHRMYINDLGDTGNPSPGLDATPGFFVLDPNNSPTLSDNFEHVGGYLNSANAQVPISAETLLVDGKGKLIIVNQNNFTPSAAAPNISTPLTILDTTKFNFFSNTQTGSAAGYGQGVFFQPGSGMTTVSASTPYTAMSAADIDTTNEILYGFAYDVAITSTSGFFGPIYSIAVAQGTGALLSYNLSTGTETRLGTGLNLGNTYLGVKAWSQLSFDIPSDELVLFAQGALAVSAPLCAGTPVPIQQENLGDTSSYFTLSNPSLNFTSAYIYDVLSQYPTTALYAIAPPSNACSSGGGASPPSPPSIAMSFGAASIPLNGSTTLTFTLVNPPANTVPLTGVTFSDVLPSGFTVATPNGLADSCGGTVAGDAGSYNVGLSGATLAAAGSCTVSVNVTATSAQVAVDRTSVNSTNGGAGNTASATMTVVAPPEIATLFGAASVSLNGTTSLTFSLTNPAVNGVALAGVSVADALPSGLAVATPSSTTSSCGGTLTAAAGTANISLSGGTLAADASCTITVNVTAVAVGPANNLTAVASTNGGVGQTASSTLTVNGALVPTITSISPLNTLLGLPLAGGFPGQSGESVTVLGTNFQDPTGNGALPMFDFGPSVTVTNVVVVSSTTATMTLAINAMARTGIVNVSVTTGSPSTFQGGTVTLVEGFDIADYTPAITSISPPNSLFSLPTASGYPGETQTLTVSGTNLVDPTGNKALPVFSFGPETSATTVSVTGALGSPQSAVVTLTISPSAATGIVSPSVSTGSNLTFEGGTGTLANGFDIADFTPTIASISPPNSLFSLPTASGYPGETETLTISGTNLLDPTGNKALPQFSFGPGTTATTVSVNGSLGSPQSAVVTLTINASAATGIVNPSVTTGSSVTFLGGTATLPGGFEIADYAPTIKSVTPIDTLLGLPLAGGYPGQTGEAITVTGTNLQDPTGHNASPIFSFGPSVTVTNVAVVSSTAATMTLAVSRSTATGLQTVSVTTGSTSTFQGGTGTLAEGYAIAAYVPSITSLVVDNPSAGEPAGSGDPGQSLTLTVTGTNFVDPTGNSALPVFTFGSTAINVTNTAITNSTTVVLTVAIGSSASPQTLGLTVMTGNATFLGGAATLPNAFQIVSLSPPPPVDITGSVGNTASGLVYSRASKTWTGTVTITNTSESTLDGPFQLVLTGLPSGATLANAAGAYNGSPYISVSAATSLAANQEVSVLITIAYSGSAKITFTPVVYSGSF